MTPTELTIAGIAAAAAGLVNALAGGGTLISFPALVALGVPPIAANVTNAVALCPGYFGAALPQLGNLRGQRRRLWLFVPAAAAGGLMGGFILLRTHERTFEALVPFMLLFAALLLAVQDRVRALVLRRLSNPDHAHHATTAAVLPIFLTAMYGGFFSAGMGVITLAVLGSLLDDELIRLNALKQALVVGINVAATTFFVFSGQVVWTLAAVMAVCALIGGAIGGRWVTRLQPQILRWSIVTVGAALAVVYWLKG